MASEGNKTEDPPQICRLCLSEESLNDVFEEEDLHQLISDYLSITISVRDRMSQSLCVICKIRLNEFHQFRINCQEAQIVQQSMIQDRDIAVEEANFENKTHADPNYDLPEIKKSPLHLESCSEELPDGTIQDCKRENYTIIHYGEEEDEQSLRLENLIDIENVKVEANTDDNLELTAQSSSDLEQTVQEKADIKSYECESCHKVYSCKRTLWHHKKRAHEAPNYNCSLCGIGYVFQCYFEQHLQSKQHAEKLNPTRYPDDPSKPYKCEICHKGFNMPSRLKWHQKAVHEPKLHVCPICDLKFGDRSKLQQHLKNHYRGTGDALSQLEKDLGPIPKKLLLKHDDENFIVHPFKCDLCPKAFKELRRLTFHKKQVHGPKVQSCGLCDFKCYSRFNLSRHERIHARESAKA